MVEAKAQKEEDDAEVGSPGGRRRKAAPKRKSVTPKRKPGGSVTPKKSPKLPKKAPGGVSPKHKAKRPAARR